MGRFVISQWFVDLTVDDFIFLP